MEIALQQKQIQSLNLVMTPALRQAIELLQYSTYELYDYLKEQALENPLVELKENADQSFNTYSRRNHTHSSGTPTTSLDWIPDNGVNMREKLIQQVNLLFKSEKEIKLLEYMINNLDDYGYLVLDDEEINTPLITRGIRLLQKIGPIGIGARNLKECLQLQLSYHYTEEKLAQVLLDNHFDLLAERRWNDIASRLKISVEEVRHIHQVIQQLNPKPCSMITDFKPAYVQPDIVIEEKDGKLSYFLHDRHLPSIHVNSEYLAMRNQGTAISKYINDQHSQVQWLLNSLEQRRRTISKITEIILKKQQRFFESGFIALQPLTLKEVAETINVHESTVSRATANKIIQTPKGTFELRSFFTSKLDTADGDAISQTTVKTLLESFIKQEDKRRPFSDQKIANYFKSEKGISISRRTISKYREELNIPSSRMRKEI